MSIFIHFDMSGTNKFKAMLCRLFFLPLTCGEYVFLLMCSALKKNKALIFGMSVCFFALWEIQMVSECDPGEGPSR